MKLEISVPVSGLDLAADLVCKVRLRQFWARS
jgi:hypothetical protein